MNAERDIIHEQIAYYRARAAEYDQTATPPGDSFAGEGERLRRWLRGTEPRGRVAELAAGTGQWTGVLAEEADALVAFDASPEMLRRNAAKVGDGRVDYRVADIFRLPATAEYDAVFFGFWLSHVPHDPFDEFWHVVEGLLVPGGRALFIDEAAPGIWPEEWIDREAGLVWRTLESGERHRAVKVLWAPEDLERRLHEGGWPASVHLEGPFLCGEAVRPGR